MREAISAARDPVSLHADRLRPEIVEMVRHNTSDPVRAILERVFADEGIGRAFNGAVIRHTTMVGDVVNRLLTELLPHESVGNMAIGDVKLPPEPLEAIQDVHRRAAELLHRHGQESSFGYDVPAQGWLTARQGLADVFDHSYGFHSVPGLREKVAENMVITSGGMRALDDIASARIREARQAGHPHRFIHQDNSFGTWKAIVQDRSADGMLSQVHEIGTEPKNLLHLTPEQVDAFYDEHPAVLEGAACDDTWCITPVGNPSGTAISPENLKGVCETIIRRNPRAVIIMDSVYVRTLTPEKSRALMSGIFSNPEVLQRIIFVESFSKTHGICGDRIGAFFSANPEVLGSPLNMVMTVSAGASHFNSALAEAISERSRPDDVIDEPHRHWARERSGLFVRLSEPRFGHLFDSEQNHIVPVQLAQPLGLYLLMKLADGVSSRQVAVETRCLGVESPLQSGRYVRFSVGRITQPTYS